MIFYGEVLLSGTTQFQGPLKCFCYWVFLHQVACAPQIPNNCDSKQHTLTRSAVNDSLLEMVESQGAVGWREAQVRVVIQRVYCLPAREGSRSHVQGNKPLCATPIINSDPPNVR